MNQKILVLTTVIFIAALSTASIFAAFTATAQTPSQTTPTVDTTYIAQNLNTTLIVTNNQTGITTVLLLRLAPDITGPSGIFVNNFSLMNTVIEFKVVSDSDSNATGGNQTVHVLGALSLLETEVDPVIGTVRSYNWSILTKQELSTLHMLYWQAEGKLSTIITNLQNILKMTSLNVTVPLVSQTTLNTTQIAEMLGGVPINSAVADVVVRRNDVNITSLNYPNVTLNDFSLMSCFFEFSPYQTNTTLNPIPNMTSQMVRVVGTFVLLDSEVDAVTRTLLNNTYSMQNNVTSTNTPMAKLTGLSGHLVHPKIMLASFEMIGDLTQTVNVINKVINQTAIRCAPEENVTQTPQLQVCNDVMNYIKTNHNETAPYISDCMNWTGGRVDTGLLGSETYVFTSDHWNVKMQYPVVPNPIYTVNATYNSTEVMIVWQGTWQDGNITETNYVFTPLGVSEQEQVRDDCMAYIKANHNQTATYIPSNIQWVGGLVETSMDGSGTYSWVGDGWNVTEQYPVVPNPIYTVNATYTSTQVQIIWQGTWQNGNITEINFIFNSSEVSEQEQVRDDCMNYIKTQHNETAPYISADINWIGGRVNTSLLGSETYSWVGSDWNITEQCPVVHSPVYTVTATYNSAQVQILWTGTWENGNITETDFVFTSSEVSEQEQVRDDCMAYIKENHSQTAPYIPASISWTGGQENTTLFGSQSYSWTSDGWTLTEQYPIVINPIYTVTAIYNSSQVHIVWEGTWQGGVIVESNFVFNSSEVSEQEQVRDDCMNYIKMNHNEAAPYIPATLIWVGGRVNTSLVGSETYTWVSGNWSLTEQYPVIPNTTYTVAAIYNSSAATIMWNGTWQDGNITESSFVFNATEVSMQEQARDDVMAYIKLMHNETAQYIPENMVWTGGRVNVSLIGSDTYSYVSDKWNLTLQYPVVLNPIFNVNATYNSSVIVWRGTWQNGNITETYFNMTGNMTENLQLQVCNEVIAFINASHPEVAPYIPSDMNWSGGRQNTSLLGSETYIFTSALWNVTLQYPVVPDPIFNVNATYNTSTIVWRGTWQSGSITETYFSANQTGPSPLPVNITLFAGDNAFGTTPTSLTSPGPPIVIPVNTVVTVTVTNVGTMPHAWAFTVQPTSQSTILFVIGSANNPLMPSETASTTFTMIQTGTFYYISLLQGDVAQGLWGTATVTL